MPVYGLAQKVIREWRLVLAVKKSSLTSRLKEDNRMNIRRKSGQHFTSLPLLWAGQFMQKFRRLMIITVLWVTPALILTESAMAQAPSSSPSPDFFSSDTKAKLKRTGKELKVLAAEEGTAAADCALIAPPAAPECGLLGVGAVATAFVSVLSDFLGDDPPDPNFTVIAQPSLVLCHVPLLTAAGTVTKAFHCR
jgi:hypothetical protein